MADALCITMGIADLLAGVLIILGFGSHLLGILFGIIMIVKGGFSFIG
jgi:uncharacterized membrane protein YphA (DoxX/SURF4 family)